MMTGMDIAARCRTLAEFHGGTDLAERVRSALALQQEQRLALAQAADEIQRLTARVSQLETENCKPRWGDA